MPSVFCLLCTASWSATDECLHYGEALEQTIAIMAFQVRWLHDILSGNLLSGMKGFFLSPVISLDDRNAKIVLRLDFPARLLSHRCLTLVATRYHDYETPTTPASKIFQRERGNVRHVPWSKVNWLQFLRNQWKIFKVDRWMTQRMSRGVNRFEVLSVEIWTYFLTSGRRWLDGAATT